MKVERRVSKAGKINADIECNPLLGEEVENVIKMLQRGETPEMANYVSEEVFTQKNVLDVLNERAY